MNWVEFKKEKISPRDGSWVLIQSSLKNIPKFEVCYYKNNDWYLPSCDVSCEEKDIVKWAYIEE